MNLATKNPVQRQDDIINTVGSCNLDVEVTGLLLLQSFRNHVAAGGSEVPAGRGPSAL